MNGRALVVTMCLAITTSGARRAVAPAENAVRGVHDPVAARCGRYVYVYSTGGGIPVRRSADMRRWEVVGRVFAESVPAWAREEAPGATGIWAPDVSFHDGRYWLYYAVSTFGSNRSVIGLATNKTLDPASKGYLWEDRGKVVESRRSDDYNAIDPAALWDGRRAWLSFGSFWSGIKLVELDPRTGKPLPGAPVRAIAGRGGGAIEAPYLFRRGRYYYLFVSFDLCCRGVNSTYNIRVGRATVPTGPYLDRSGVDMNAGGGTLLLATDGAMVGPGHCAVLRDRGVDWLIYHFYNRDENGAPNLQLRPLRWTADGWPEPGEAVG